ncbi:MAG TPA: M15 family metallopeptidase [Kofleriaceae bacterium]|nr:M15 family metallopeptidase [Kofleriaceae bacterium]
MWLQRLGTAVLVASCVGCVEAGDEETGTSEELSTVGDYVNTGCSTAVVIGLSQQISDEVACMKPNALVKFSAGSGISFASSAVLPYLGPSARDDLKAVGAGGGTMQVTSAFRTVAQQYLLYRWYQQGRCGITAAATPGRSNHETGRAVDVSNYSSYVSRMSAKGWAHDVAGDPVHFDHLSSADIRGTDVMAFQRLWNRNHPNDLIDEDGVYGPQTGARIAMAPSGGFAKGPTCGAPQTRAVSARIVSSPGALSPGASGVVTIELSNTGDVAWSAATVIETADQQPSALADTSHWMSTTQVASLGQSVAPGALIDVDVPVIAPPSDVATHVDEALTLDDGGTTFGVIALTVQVVPPGASPSDDTNNAEPEDDDGGPVIAGGCSAGGGGAGGGALLIGLALARAARARRRRAA